MEIEWHYKVSEDFPGGPVVNSPPCNAGDTRSILGQEDWPVRSKIL